jgi:hypothetical protein
MLLEQVLARWRRVVASRKALNFLYQAMCATGAPPRAKAIKTASKGGAFFIVVLFAVALAATKHYRASRFTV